MGKRIALGTEDSLKVYAWLTLIHMTPSYEVCRRSWFRNNIEDGGECYG
jgi:hypothetical protein